MNALTPSCEIISMAGYKRIMDFTSHIVRDPNICGAEPVIRGTRVPLRTILASFAEGARNDEILKDFPTLNEEHLRAVIAFAASSAEEDLPTPAIPSLL